MRTLARLVALGLVVVTSAAASGTGVAAAPAEVVGEEGAAGRRAGTGPASACAGSDRTHGAESPRGGFVVELLGEVSHGGAVNALVSPLGVELVLAMLAQGATEPVRGSIREMLGGRHAVAGPPCALAAIRADASRADGVGIRVANAAYLDLALDLYPSFSAVLEDRFGARVERLDFADPSAPARINAWVAEETDGAIPTLVSSLAPDDVLLLANAVDFRGAWSQPFDPARTAPLPFHPHDGTTVEVDTMQALDLSVRYREDEQFQAVALPYGSGAFELVVALPRQSIAPVSALGALRSDPTWLGGERFRRDHGALALPRVTLREEASLLPALGALGLDSALEDADSFGGIAYPSPTLSRVVHRTMLDLDEEGTEAAAATAAVFTTRAAIPEGDGFEMRVDRPFALSVRHVGSRALLFAAWVAYPTAD